MQSVVVIGSTGPLGLATLEVIADHRGHYMVDALVNEGTDARLLAEQVMEFTPLRLGVTDEYRVGPYRGELTELGVDAGLVDWEMPPTEVLTGDGSINEICDDSPGIVVVDQLGEAGDPLGAAVGSDAALIVVCEELADEVAERFGPERASGRIVLAGPGDDLAGVLAGVE